MYKSLVQDLRLTRMASFVCYMLLSCVMPSQFFSGAGNCCSDYATVFVLHCGFHNVLLVLWLASRSVLPPAVGKYLQKSALPVEVIQILMSRMFYDLC